MGNVEEKSDGEDDRGNVELYGDGMGKGAAGLNR
jgi:hypothetical protein